MSALEIATLVGPNTQLDGLGLPIEVSGGRGGGGEQCTLAPWEKRQVDTCAQTSMDSELNLTDTEI